MRVVQFRVPKTASSSLEECFRKLRKADEIKYRSHGHATWRPIFRYYDKTELSKAIIVGSCRNPYDRLLSAYKYVIQFKENKKDHPSLNFYFQSQNFENFCKRLHEFRGRNLFLREQHQWLYDTASKPLYTELIHFEKLEKEWKQFSKKYHLTFFPLPVIRQTKRKESWKKYYTKEMKESVYQFFQKDFSLLGYKK